MRRARLFYEWGRGIAPLAIGPVEASVRADRLYRKALRTIDCADPRPGLAGLVLRQSLERAVRSHSALGWLARHRRVGLRVALGAALALGGLIAVVPAVRRMAFPVDLADGKPWVASSATSDLPATGVMGDPSSPIGLFHTVEEMFPSLTIDLGRRRIVHDVVVANRRDCCRERALPLAVELSDDGVRWRRVGYRRAEFRNWTASFPAASARFVRLRVDRRSILHLGRVAVH